MKLMKAILLFIFFVFISCNKEKDNEQKILKEEYHNSNATLRTSVIQPTETTKGKINNIDVGCGYTYRLKGTNIDLSLPQKRETEQINSILQHVGIPMNFEFYSANIENAVATLIDNKRYIIYDQRLFNFSDKLGATYWNSMSILAHEIGHHLSGHTLNIHNNLDIELEADKFSGFILFKMGAKLSEATNAIILLGAENDSDTHPSKHRRIAAITNGWNEANSQRYSSAIPPPPIDDDDVFQINVFNEEDILSQDMIEYVNNYENNHNDYEGIIINIDREDPSGNNIDPYHNMLVTIELTKVNKENYDENRKIGQRYQFNLIDYYQKDRVTLSWLEALMVPGRKIRFKSFYIGWGSESFTYIEKKRR